jgi:spermidine synthase
MAALSWEVLWQLQASLATGVSATGTAITLSATMGGMTLGSLVAGHVLEPRIIARPLLIYGALELAIGLAGIGMLPGFALLERLDAVTYAAQPDLAPVVHALGIVLIIGVPTFAMGASIPILKLVAGRSRASLATLYGMNTLGASAGVLLLSFVVLPALGVAQSVACIATVNVLVFALCLTSELRLGLATSAPPADERTAFEPGKKFSVATLVVFATGCATFALEVAWFRSLRAAFQSTTFSFAIMLTSVLIPLAVAARAVPWLRRVGITLPGCLALGGMAILVATPLLERVDQVAWVEGPFWSVQGWRLLVSLTLLGPPVLLMGVVLPWCLDEFRGPRKAGVLYATNTVGAVLGSLSAAWLLLPQLGFARSSWIVGSSILLLAIGLGPPRLRVAASLAGGAALLLAIQQTSSLGRDRILAHPSIDYSRIIAFDEGPDSTVAVVEARDGDRFLVIDGTLASGDFESTGYMEWMGRLPVLLHPSPANALVICFGAGQTAYSVTHEGAQHLDIVDISAAVLSMGPLFDVNHAVLEDPRVRSVVMDGRAWLRRTRDQYDVITLEPMPPYHAGVNALYAKEFYEHMKQRLNPGGVVAQWLPLYLVSAFDAASIAATFTEVFPDSMLWMVPGTPTGILLGREQTTEPALGTYWPGTQRQRIERGIPADEIPAAVALDREGLLRFAHHGSVITDDNQLLAYRQGERLQTLHDPSVSLAMIRRSATSD